MSTCEVNKEVTANEIKKGNKYTSCSLKAEQKKCINAEAKTANKAKQFNLDYILIEKNISRILIEDYSFHGKIEKKNTFKI